MDDGWGRGKTAGWRRRGTPRVALTTDDVVPARTFLPSELWTFRRVGVHSHLSFLFVSTPCATEGSGSASASSASSVCAAIGSAHLHHCTSSACALPASIPALLLDTAGPSLFSPPPSLRTPPLFPFLFLTGWAARFRISHPSSHCPYPSRVLLSLSAIFCATAHHRTSLA